MPYTVPLVLCSPPHLLQSHFGVFLEGWHQFWWVLKQTTADHRSLRGRQAADLVGLKELLQPARARRLARARPTDPMAR